MEGFARRYPSVLYITGSIILWLQSSKLFYLVDRKIIERELWREGGEIKGGNEKEERETGKKNTVFKVCFWIVSYFRGKVLNPPYVLM